MGHYQLKARVQRLMEDGARRTKTENYIVQGLTCVDAQAILTHYLKEETDEFEIKTVSQTPLQDVFLDDEQSFFWKAKVCFVAIDENAGIEKTVKQQMLVQADDFYSAYKRLKEEFKGFTVPYDILSLTETSIYEYLVNSEE